MANNIKDMKLKDFVELVNQGYKRATTPEYRKFLNHEIPIYLELLEKDDFNNVHNELEANKDVENFE